MEAKMPSHRRILETFNQSSAVKFAENFEGWRSPEESASIEPGLFGQDGAHGSAAMLFSHHHLEIGGGLVFGFRLTGAPFQ